MSVYTDAQQARKRACKHLDLVSAKERFSHLVANARSDEVFDTAFDEYIRGIWGQGYITGYHAGDDSGYRRAMDDAYPDVGM